MPGGEIAVTVDTVAGAAERPGGARFGSLVHALLADAPGVDRWQVLPRMPSVALAGIDFSTQGQLAVASHDGLVRIFDATSRELIAVHGPHRRIAAGHAAVALQFSPDGRWLASAGRDGVRFWNSQTGVSTSIGVANSPGARAVSWQPSGERIAVAYEREVGEDDLGVSYYKDDAVDLSEIVREQFYLALPMKPLCREDCKGLCPVCGKNRNREACTCQSEWVDPRLEPLKNLRTEN